MLEDNAFLYHEIGTQCGKCLEANITVGRVTFVGDSSQPGGVIDSTDVARVAENRSKRKTGSIDDVTPAEWDSLRRIYQRST